MEETEVIQSLAALAHSLRLRVFRALVVAGPGGLTPGDLATQLEVGATALSFHLKELSHAQLITQERDGRYLVYRAAFDRMNALLSFMTDNCCGGQSCCPPAHPAAKASTPTAAKR